MKMIKKLLVVVIIASMTAVNLQAEKEPDVAAHMSRVFLYDTGFLSAFETAVIKSRIDDAKIENTQLKKLALDVCDMFPDDALARSAFEIALVRRVIHSTPTNTQVLSDGVYELNEKLKKISALFNFVCAQAYVNHLKELKGSDDLDPENHYTKNNPTAAHSRLSDVMIEGAQYGVKFIKEAGDDQFSALFLSYALLEHAESFLCPEFESSYMKLFDLEDSLDIRHPHYSRFCKVSDNKSEVKNEL